MSNRPSFSKGTIWICRAGQVVNLERKGNLNQRDNKEQLFFDRRNSHSREHSDSELAGNRTEV